MPWTGKTFAPKNHSLSPQQANHAARIANAILRRGESDRVAIATANKRVEHPVKRAAGGITIAALPASQPSYLGGTMGSPVNTGALPSYTPQTPSNMGINAASGLMNTPQSGTYQLDPTTGGLTAASRQALVNYAQRGLPIGNNAGASAGASAAAGQQSNPYLSVQSLNGGADVGGNASGNNGGGQSVGDLSGLGSGPNIGGVVGGALGAIGGGLVGGPMGAISGGRGGYAVGSALDPNSSTPGSGNLGGFSSAQSGTDFGNPGGGSGVDIGGEGDGTAEARESRRGGSVKRAAGGMMPMSMADPSWAKTETSNENHPSGLVNSPIGGRSDHIPIALGSGSYVVPADVVSGMGQGNTLAGAHAFDSMVHSGPFGTKLPMPKIKGTLPKPPGMPKMVGAQHFSRGGRMRGKVPVIVAGGERIVSPAECKIIGGGDIKKGHDLLDKFVVECRKHVVAHTKALPGPVGMKK